uniref:Uncharacterized protein n=1 Tax=Oryza nivara TaxID=4536 RepID=A0A0E0GJI8_ORYNI
MSPASSPTATRLPKRSTILLGKGPTLISSCHFIGLIIKYVEIILGSMRSDGYAPGDDNVACRLMWRRTIR